VSQFRHRWRIILDGEKFEVTTTARDMRALQLDLNSDEPTMSPVDVMLVVHAALIRTGAANVPSDPEEFLDLVDDLDDLEPGAMVVMDPTRTARSDA
jgi:hypothetical protein